MRNTEIFGHIARKHLDAYSVINDIPRPLSPEQVKDASVLLMDEMAAIEAKGLLVRECQGEMTPLDSTAPLRSAASLFAECYLVHL